MWGGRWLGLGRRARGLRAARAGLRRLREASDQQQWQRVVDIGVDLLDRADDQELPDDAKPHVRLVVGRANFNLGESDHALAMLSRGLAEAPAGIAATDLGEYRYIAGMAAMTSGDIDTSAQHLQAVLDHADDAEVHSDEFPWGSARRALAQVHDETGDSDAALAVLAPLMAREPSPMTWAAHGRAAHRVGDQDRARQSLSWAWTVGSSYPDHDAPAAQATVATMLVTVAEVLVELGHAGEAAEVLDEGERRFDLAVGITPHAARAIPVLRAEIARLRGDLEAAERLLGEVVPAADEPELAAARARATARTVRDRGRVDEAKRHYDDAVRAFDGIGYRHQADVLRAEVLATPPSLEPHPTWGVAADEPDQATDVVASGPEDAVLVVLPLSDEETGAPGETLDLQDEALGWERAVEGVGGEFDGWLTGGGEFMVYLYGDPDRVWSAIESDVRGLARRVGGGHVVLRRGDEEDRLDL